jgi:hypothetical protein
VLITRDEKNLRRMFFPFPYIEAGEGLILTTDVAEIPVDDLHEDTTATADGVSFDEGNREEDRREEETWEEGKEVWQEEEAAEEVIEDTATTHSGRVGRIPTYLR